MKPTKERRDHWPLDGPILRTQPPVRIRWCRTYDAVRLQQECRQAGASCSGSLAICPNCRFEYCESHAEDHVEGLTVPPDAWKGVYVKMAKSIERAANIKHVAIYVKEKDNRVMTDYRVGNRILDSKPPARIEFCDVPSTGRVNSDCGHQSKPCTGGTNLCDWCRFTYCDRHIAYHIRRIAVPLMLWNAVAERLEKGMDAVLRGERKLVWVKVPRMPFAHPPEA